MFLISECSSYQNLDVLLHIGKSSQIAKGIIILQKNSFVSKDDLKNFGGQKYADISRPPCWALYCKTDAHIKLLCKKWRNLFCFLDAVPPVRVNVHYLEMATLWCTIVHSFLPTIFFN